MKILLVNPPNDHVISSHIPEYVGSQTGHLPPLGLLYIATTLEQNGHSVVIHDALIHGSTNDEIGIIAKDFDMVGVTAITFFLMDVVNAVQAIRKHNPSTPIALGGPHVAIYPEESLAIPGVTYSLTGEAEHSFSSLADLLEAGATDLSSVPGLFWHKDGQVVQNCAPSLIEDLDSLPIPDRSLLEYESYRSILSQNTTSQHYVATAFSSRGCPYKCVFCDRPHFGKLFRAHSYTRMIKEVELCLSLGINEIFYYDDTFTIDKDRVMNFCETAQEKQLDFSWDVRARVNTVDVAILKAMREAGCSRVHFGVESGTVEILNALQKGITLQQAESAFYHAREAGIEALGYFMIGCPNETESQMHQTLNFAMKLDPDYMHLSILTPFPGTRLYENALRDGLYDDDYWLEYAKNPTPDFVPPFLPNTEPPEVLLALTQRAYRRFYLRPQYLIKQAKKVRNLKNFMMKAKIAMNILLK